MNMKKVIIIGLMLVLMIKLVAAEVCVVVDYGNGEVDSECVEIDEGKSGYDVMEEAGLDITWSEYYLKTVFGTDYDYGHSLCKISDIGEEVDYSSLKEGMSCEWNKKYQESFWNFVLVDGTEWGHLPVGFDGGNICWNRDFSWSDWTTFVHYCVQDGDFIGVAFGPAGAEPDMFKVNVSKIYVDGEKQRESKTKGGKIVDVFPESKVKIKIELENLYKHSTDIDITDILIEGTIEEIEDGDDIDEELSEFDLEADKKTTKDLEFLIPLEVEAKDRLLKIEISAEDDAGIRYEQEFTFDMEVEKENHKLKVIDAELNKEAYKCGENALLRFSLLNIGAKDEDIRLNVVNDELELNIVESFELSNDVYDESSSYEKRFNIWLPDDIEIKSYPITITADYDDKETETVDLIIDGCDGKIAVTQSEVDGVVDVHAGDIVENSHQHSEITEAIVEDDTTVMELTITNNLPLILTGVLIVIIIIIVALGIGFFVLRK